MNTPEGTQRNANSSFLKTAAISFALLLAFVAGVKTYANRKAATELDAVFKSLSAFITVKYKDVDFALLSQRLTVSDVAFFPSGITALDSREQESSSLVKVRSLSVDNALTLSLNKIGFEAKGVELNSSALGVESDIKKLGMKGPLLMDFVVSLEIDAKGKELTLNNLYLRLQELASLSIGFKIGNLELSEEKIAKIKSDPTAAMGVVATMMGSTLNSAQISYVDESLAQKLMLIGAKNEETSVEEYKSGIIEQVKRATSESEDEFVKSLAKPVISFINKPHKLSLKAAPSKPLPFLALAELEPDNVISALAIRLE